MEGAVHALGDDHVVKVWTHRGVAELERLRDFAAAVALPGIATARIARVVPLEGGVATIETRLPGRPLRTTMDAAPRWVPDEAVEAVVTTLAALRAAPVSAPLRALPLLPGEGPAPADRSFEEALADLVVRRSPGPLADAVPDLDLLVERLVSHLRTRPPADPRLLHGDLIPANLHVDDAGAPVALLDFGFLTTTGDPAFDAAVTASVHDMYGARGRETEAVLDAAIADRLGDDPADLHRHRAAYALVTATCYSASGSDGHFAWCADLLQRTDVRDAVLS